VPELSGHDLVREWKAAMQSVIAAAASVAGRPQVPDRLRTTMERQVELLQELLERERRIQHEALDRLFGPFDAIFDLLEQSGTALRRQAEALSESARALEQAADLMRIQAETFERTVQTLREPAEIAKSAAGLERRRRKS
jgi:hypothetical protein